MTANIQIALLELYITSTSAKVIKSCHGYDSQKSFYNVGRRTYLKFKAAVMGSKVQQKIKRLKLMHQFKQYIYNSDNQN